MKSNSKFKKLLKRDGFIIVKNVLNFKKDLKPVLNDMEFVMNCLIQKYAPKIYRNKVLNYGFKFPTIASPLSYVSKRATIGDGTIVMHGAIINAGAKIGKNCIINNKTLIEHDVVIEDNCHLSTRSTVNGGVTIKNNSFIGSCAVIKQNIKIGKNCFVNANLFIEKDLKDNSKIL